MILCTEELAAKIDKAVFPFTQGGPLMHSIAGKAVALKQCLEPAYSGLCAAGDRELRGRSPTGWAARACASSPAAPTPT
jgi:hypothetical protein